MVFTTSRLSPWTGAAGIAFGVLLPLIALGFEVGAAACSTIFFDPTPTPLYAALVALVPVANLAALIGLHRGTSGPRHLLLHLNAMAAGIALFYTLLFAPAFPLCLIGLIIGLGLLPLAPLFSLLMALYLRRDMVRGLRASGAPRVPRVWLGLATGFLVLIGIELPSTWTRAAMVDAASRNPDVRARALGRLRAWGKRDQMLRACYERSRMATDLVGHLFEIGDPVTVEEAREIYYRVTGVPFENEPTPRLTGRGRFDSQGFAQWDPFQGGERVGDRLAALTLAESRLDGSVDPDAALGYLEWTWVIRNGSDIEREARALVHLPPGGAVSRLTLWIGGEEREAAFAGRSRVRAAYEAVVNRRRDPVLVTTRGVDTVLVQCFPVPPKGAMKLRFGVTLPMRTEAEDRAAMTLPLLGRRNFGVPADLRHGIWLESRGAPSVPPAGLAAERRGDVHALRGDVPEVPAGEIAWARGGPLKAWSPDPKDPRGWTLQTLRMEKPDPPERLVIVLDSSAGMRGSRQEIAEAIRRVPEGTEAAVVLAADAVETWGPPRKADAAWREELAKRIAALEPAGGIDNVPALLRGWDLAGESRKGAVLWLHAPQQRIFEGVESLRQRLERRPEGPVVIDAPVRPGDDVVGRELESLRAYRPGRTSAPAATLRNLFEPRWGAERVRMEKGEPPGGAEAKRTSDHLTRLWALDRARAGGDAEMAARYQLVTPVSGAVVLETREQFASAGLAPAEKGSVPSVPEPGFWTLLAVAAVVPAVLGIRRLA